VELIADQQEIIKGLRTSLAATTTSVEHLTKAITVEFRVTRAISCGKRSCCSSASLPARSAASCPRPP
jgi:hypothetical protein